MPKDKSKQRQLRMTAFLAQNNEAILRSILADAGQVLRDEFDFKQGDLNKFASAVVALQVNRVNELKGMPLYVDPDIPDGEAYVTTGKQTTRIKGIDATNTSQD